MAKISKRGLDRTLCIIYLLCGETKRRRIPLEAIESKVPRHERGKIKKAVKELLAKGLIYEKRHGKGRKSYRANRKRTKKSTENMPSINNTKQKHLSITTTSLHSFPHYKPKNTKLTFKPIPRPPLQQNPFWKNRC